MNRRVKGQSLLLVLIDNLEGSCHLVIMTVRNDIQPPLLRSSTRIYNGVKGAFVRPWNKLGTYIPAFVTLGSTHVYLNKDKGDHPSRA